MSSTKLAVRRSLTNIQDDYDKGNKTELENLMRAWKGIQELPPEDLRSFFMIGGYHGEPFRGPGETSDTWWGGYCQHGTVLFPSWHRAYLMQLERALQTIPGCSDVTLPFWDECSALSADKGIPRALTDETFMLDGKRIPNPLRSFELPVAIVDQVAQDAIVYSKPAGYETVRYPLSGLVGTENDALATKAHNAQFPSYTANVGYLNDNVTTWLNGKIRIGGKWQGEVSTKFSQCLDAPNYTLFSNTTSAGAWNKNHSTSVVPLESPHNYMHLAVGGFDYPGQGDASAIPGANGDMGENDTAGLDPIFFFHHCFIDYTFWTWQRRHGATDSFTIDSTDTGTKYTKDNPPPAGADPDERLSMTTELKPFKNADGKTYVTTADCINIESQLGYTYGPGSLETYAQQTSDALTAELADVPDGHTVRVAGINRADIRGSFLISAYATVDGEREYLGTEPILSRWHVEGCMNCQTHLEAQASFRLPAETATKLGAAPGGVTSGVEVEVLTREGLLGGRAFRTGAGGLTAGASADDAPFTIEIR
ncbi:tyrosinase family protein [Rhodococcus sp. IEGM 1379]|uniref:tyrosinase family protein n=1 Tax=Rhodococcus sp. IEGM 1379 TaxID=3047086 RepID=UPI0024B78B08|nr:tyrosinase family protein [Rhodococcus sp. IEGM 1379]MDI9913692.1 tyrosinase family protein [Rhodococcus sp. IEGM 1379]